MTLRRKPRWTFLGLCLGLCVATPAPSYAEPAPLRIGLVAPLTGGSEDLGASTKFGAELAVQEINEAGGYLGRPLKLVERNDKSVPQVGEQIAHELVDKEKVDFTIGYCNTGVALQAAKVFQASRSLLMIPCSQGTAVTRQFAAADSYIFRNAPYDLLNAKFLVSEIVERRRLKKVAIFADKTGYGEGGLKDVTAELAARGLQPAYVARFAPGVESLASEMEQAAQSGAQAIVVYAVGPDQVTVLKGRRAAHVKLPLLSTWALSARSVLELGGPDLLEGTMMVQTVIYDIYNERRAGFLAKYFKMSNDRPISSLMAAAQSYDAVYLMLAALFQTHGDVSGPALKAALETLPRPIEGVVTTYDHPFDATDHDAISQNMLWLGVWHGGEIRFYYPEDAKLSSVVRRKDHVGAPGEHAADAAQR
ncbi:MAG TPA: ABC transporter substrate-binding protein [Burkholderiaceae bacterium]